MNYQDTIDKALAHYPMLYLRYENLVVLHIFFGAGNGYEWINGELVDDEEPSTHKHTEAEITALVADNDELKVRIDKLQIEIDNGENDVVKRILLKVSKGLYKAEPIKMRWVSESSPIVNVPWDITKDWFEASVKALRWGGTLECTDDDKRWLMSADLRLCFIENGMDEAFHRFSLK